jgi:hypothetical protein
MQVPERVVMTRQADVGGGWKATPQQCCSATPTLPRAPEAPIMPAMRRLAACLFGGATLLAQAPSPPPPQAQRTVIADRVVATVNDAAILMSELRTLAAGQVRSAEARIGRRLQPNELISIYKAVLESRIEGHAMAQAAKTFGIATPEQVESLFQSELEREEREQVRDLGTWQEFSKELQRQGRTWDTYLRERRVEKMKQFAEEFAIHMRLQKQGNLFVTPRMLREMYEQQRAQFVHGPRAAAVLVSFEGAEARQTAERAAALWRTEALSGRELLDRFPGVRGQTTELGGITEESRESLATEVADFALKGPENAVSAPIALGGAWRVVKIAAYSPARNGQFEDADVQVVLRDYCQRGVIEELRRQAVERAKQRTEAWVTPELR